jgi:pimeloyl-ACP methyl ester carboxylesterase
MWDDQFDHPVPGHRYVRSDMRGYGRSEWVAEPFSPTTDVETVIDHLGLDDMVLVGCSMGGRVVMEVAVRHPERVAGLVVIGSGTPDWEPPGGWYVPPQYEGSEQLFREGRWDEAARLDTDVWGVGVGRHWDDVDPGFLERMIEMDRIPVQTEYERDEFQGWAEDDMLARVGEISAPILVVVGEHDLPSVVAGTEDLAKRSSDRQLVTIAASAHLPSMERPEVFRPVFEAFLASV